MIFVRILLPAITSVIATTKSSLQTSILSVGGQFVAIIRNGRGALGTPNENNYPGSSMITERKSRFEGNDFASYAIRNDAIADILSSIQIRFGLALERWILWHVNVLGLIIGFGIKTVLWLRCSTRLYS